MNFTKRTHTCGDLNSADTGNEVSLNGWVDQVRDLGGVIFINLRDRYGVTQLTFNLDNAECYNIAKELRNEFVISVSGVVQKRSSANPNMKTGEIEILVNNIEILNRSEVPPFVIGEEAAANEDLRLKYRYLDLRNSRLRDNILIRSEILQITREYFFRNGFAEIETPILMKSTPEGARDYLVPSRVHNGKFYALPQSPQTYKQILMVAGFDRYIQLCKCFRDEDLRADRQPEFTQIDLEMSFVTQEDVFEIVEGCMKEIWKKAKGIDLNTPFPRMAYDDAMFYYGIDKPDLRYGMRIVHLTTELETAEFAVFRKELATGGIVAGIKLEGKEVPRKKIDELTDFVKSMGFGGMAYIKVQQNEASSSIKKFLTDEHFNTILSKFEAKAGDIIFILTGEKKKVCESLGKLRIKLADEYLRDDIKNKFAFGWIIDFPLFAWDEKENRFAAEHHMFTSPKDKYLPNLDSGNKDDILAIRADCYDLVLNGVELGSGSIRIHKPDIQSKVFKVLGLTEEEAKVKFGFLLEAFKYGAPPHGGAAFGFDRIVALLTTGQNWIKDFIAFPKTTSAMSLMDSSPSEVDERQLKELGITINSNN